MKPAVESHIRRQLSVEEVALVTALRPEGINFTYVDQFTLQLDVDDSERHKTFNAFARPGSQTLVHGSSIGGWGGRGKVNDRHRFKSASDRTRVLIFEFIDGDPKRQISEKTTEHITRPNKRLRQEMLRTPVYSHKQLTRLIEKRDKKFANAINDFLNSCQAQNLDPLAVLQTRAEALVPKMSTQEDNTSEWTPSAIPDHIPKQRKAMADIVKEVKKSPWYSGQIVPDGHRVFEPQQPIYGHLDFLLSQNLVNALYNAKGIEIEQLYAHQAEALNALQLGQNVVVATSTSSGKSLIYQLPVLQALERDSSSRAMYIFPTKALAQDQRRSLQEMVKYMPGQETTVIETFDGDTPIDERSFLREHARVIFTNPDMLHATILPQEERWRTFMRNLKFVVVDELHHYNGQLGSHVAFAIRRLRRICAAVGNMRVRFISCSATVTNPREHFRTIFGIDDVRLIDHDGSPSGRKEFICWNTPYNDPGDPASGRGSAKSECARLFCALMLRGVRIIAFCRVRAQCEGLVSAIKHELESLGRPECVNLVMGYRGGYTAPDRRRIETEMFEGKLLGIVATTALELGVDIGTLDCVMSWGFPYTIANLRQQSGRAGRRNRDSLSVLVGDRFATDQHFMHNPGELFTRPNAKLVVDLENLLIREGHIQCAAYEMPLQPEIDAQYFGQDLAEVCEARLLRDETGFYNCHPRFRPNPSRYIAIRDTEDTHFAIIDVTNGGNVILEELEAFRAPFTIYDGAVFLHQGSTYLVKDFLPDKQLAKVERVKVDWTTTQRNFSDIDPVEIEAIRKIPFSLSQAYHGTIRIHQQVFGYIKVDKKGRVLDAVRIDNPPVIRYSKGMWLDVPKKALEILQGRRLNLAAAIHAAEHAVMSLLPTFVVSTPEDVRTECKVALKEFAKETQRKRPARLAFYDAKGGAGGSGISSKAFDHIDRLLATALQRVEGCLCQLGCLECVASESCKQSNEVLSKPGSRIVLRSLLNLDIDFEALPMGPESHSPVGIETVIMAQPICARRSANRPITRKTASSP
ncbi:hypothetical protein CDD83_3819 [Cordyceps sp. RAO-2017]|nr:hypothetical protein CDD83_3819 [Cordyceps sp. RAO-2017]